RRWSSASTPAALNLTPAASSPIPSTRALRPAVARSASYASSDPSLRASRRCPPSTFVALTPRRNRTPSAANRLASTSAAAPASPPPQPHPHPPARHPFGPPSRRRPRLARQQAFGPADQVHLAAEPAERLGQFAARHPGTEAHQPAGEFGQLEHGFVRQVTGVGQT